MEKIDVTGRISSYGQYQKKLEDYKNHITKMMVGKKDQPIACHVMIVSGDKGVGKTYTAERILEKQTIRNYQVVNSSMSAVQLYKFLWEHNDAIIVLDDVNSILQDKKDGASLLKACTETKHIRKLSWQKQNHNCIPVHMYNLKDNKAIQDKMDDIAIRNPKLLKAKEETKLFPDMFYFTGALIILTNKPLKEIDKYTEGAVSNRGWHQEMLFTIDGAIDLIKNSADKMKTFNDIPIKVTNIRKAISFLTSKAAYKFYTETGKLPTLRTLGKIALEYEMSNKVDYDTLDNNTEQPAY